MKNKLKIFLIFLLITFSNLSIAKSDDKYCLDKEGLLLPLFDESDCLTSEDLEINQNEFSLLIEIEADQRHSKLKYFRENPKETEVVNEEKQLLSKVKKNQELTPSEKRKLIAKQKKVAKLAKELEKKELIKAKKEKRLLEQKKRQAEIRKKAELRKKEIEKKKREKLAQKKQKELEKKLKKEEEKKKAKIRKLKEIAEKKKKLDEIKLSKKIKKEENKKLDTIDQKNIEKSINNDLKIVLLDNKIVNNQLLPKITGKIDIVEQNNVSNEYLDNLTEFNKNILIIIPKDFENSSVRVSENRMLSQVVVGIDQIPNPEINRIEAELRSAERDYLIAERNFQIGTSSATNYNPYGGWSSIINQWAGLAQQAQAGKQRDDARQRYERWSAKLSSTPLYLEKERLGSYNYDVIMIKSEKKSIYDILSYNNEKFYLKSLEIDEVKNFKVAYGLNPQDKNYNNLQKKYSTEEEVSLWNNQKIKDISIDALKTKIQTSGEFQKLDSEKVAYKYLGKEIEEESFWSKLFGFDQSKKDKKNKTASLTKNSSYETKDERFESVVVVKSSSGMGSGFFISKDEILTNYHVVEGALSISIIDKNNKKSSAVIVKKDLKRDLALLKTNMTGKPVTFYNGQLKQGTMVEALGHPKGRKFSLTKGWISAIRKEASTYSVSEAGDVLFIQTDAAINPGNSGGPLFYKNKVVGVNTQGLHKDVSEGMNFAVHFSEVNQFLSK